MARYYYRCTGCLEPVALAEKLPMAYSATIATCGTCNQPMEYLGRVQRDWLVKDSEVCKCDERCTSARGPKCNCACGGDNHGAGMAGYVTVSTIVGHPPVIHAATTERMAKGLAQFEAYRELAAHTLRQLDSYLGRRRNGEFMPRADFDRMRALQLARGKASKARTHAARMKTLSAVAATA